MSRIERVRAMGAVLLAVATVMLVSVPGAWAASNYKALYNFTGGADGSGPAASLIFDAAGNLYGTTLYGGGGNCSLGCGTVFKLSPASGGSTKTVLYSFGGPTGDGAYPYAGLVFDGAGNLYGTTIQGGVDGNGGTVFKLTPNSDGSWTESVLYGFCSLTNCVDGLNPTSNLISDATGSLYGTTIQGGAANDGTVFKLTPKSDGSWQESVLYSFCSRAHCGDGAEPYLGGLVFDARGNLYGTTQGGGARIYGVAFKLTPTAHGTWKESVLHNFCSLSNCRDGEDPYAGLTFDAAGNLYGTTLKGGPFGKDYGVVFKLTLNTRGVWEEKVLHQFTGGGGGGFPAAGLVFDGAGNLYGTTGAGGSLTNCSGHGCGVAFKLTPSSQGGWNETVLHAFDNLQGTPSSALILDAEGNVYGAAAQSNTTTFGSVYEITP
jgi:uncharacterized repeat protein (TIGR03803 family)